MATDLPLTELDIPQSVRDKIAALAIRGVRQFHARLGDEGPGLQRYLELSDSAYTRLFRHVEDVVRRNFPDDRALKAHPSVNKTGVAVHRLKK